MHFADLLIARLRELGQPLCAGFDPHLSLVPPCFRRGEMRPADPATAEAVEALGTAFLDRVAGRVAVVKPFGLDKSTPATIQNEIDLSQGYGPFEAKGLKEKLLSSALVSGYIFKIDGQ